MKKCNACGSQVDDQLSSCPMCGSIDFTMETPPSLSTASENSGNGNIIAGVVGAFLFSLIGGVLYFLIYQLGYIAGITGLIMFVLANFGYKLFAKCSDTIIGLISSIVMTVLMIYAAEYFCVSFEIYQAYKSELEITIFDAVRLTPVFLAEAEINEAFIGDLIVAYLFSILASISNIIGLVKGRKKQS